MVNDPRGVVRQLETETALPSGAGERFAGYGIMGLPFTSSHILALRRFPVSSIGPGYTSVWHRNPAGTWIFYADVDPDHSCSRYFGDALVRSERSLISMIWSDPSRLTIKVPAAELTWEVGFTETPATWLLNGVSAALPAALLRWPAVLAAMARVAGWTLGAGRLQLLGCTPNGQRFRV